MFVIVIFGIAFAVLALSAIFLLMFVDVASKPHGASTGRHSTLVNRPRPGDFLVDTTENQQATIWIAKPDVAGNRPLPSVHTEVPQQDVLVNWQLLLSRHTRHLRIVAALLVVAGGGAMFVRNMMIPEAFGERGPYRSAALEQIAAQPSVLSSDTSCLKCHASVHDERAESPHKAVRCLHCHGNGHEHIAAAMKAIDSPGHAIPPAADWDGDFSSTLDLFVTKDRATCLSCHASVVGMPASFRSIDVAKHLEEQGAENPNDKNVCFECHTGHSPGIK